LSAANGPKEVFVMTNAGSSGAAVLFATFRGVLVNASLAGVNGKAVFGHQISWAPV
jgi:hypothetical protein